MDSAGDAFVWRLRFAGFDVFCNGREIDLHNLGLCNDGSEEYIEKRKDCFNFRIRVELIVGMNSCCQEQIRLR